jgi:UDP-N-acetylmuramate: L-alanyl-gamma-D-glutamyl-meso-diaminopimelate ligase
MSDQLRALGIHLTEGFSADQLAIKPDLWVVGNVVSRGNPLMEAILNAGQPYISGPQWLAEQVLKDKWVLAVAGTHGKTTTSSMLAWILEANGYNPGFLIGGVPGNFGVSARLGDSFFVIEADEYDTAFFDKRSKFVHYRPRTAVLNNLEFDHADIFADLATIETQFHHLVRTIPGKGRIIANAQSPALVRAIAKGVWSELELFGMHDTAALTPLDWALEDKDELADSSRFSIHYQQSGAKAGGCELALAGQHNRLNAMAAVAAARHIGLSVDHACAALKDFKGVKRRLEVRGVVKGITVIDDFAHHPTAIETTIAGLRARIGADKRILAVLEPRSNTMKMGAVKAALGQSLQGADRVYCYEGGLEWNTAEALQSLGLKSRSFQSMDLLISAIASDAKAPDHILVMSNGGFGGIHQKLLDLFSKT